MPTGWGVQLALMRQVAQAEGVRVDPDDEESLARWWAEAHGEPTYSALLEELAATQTERQAILQRFFTPTDEERAEGLKVPGRAHESIARLVAAGAIRLVLTTNFDRLIEQSLEARGIEFDVWSSPEEIIGGVPLEHGRTVVVKLHGDYRRTNLRNTELELSEYPNEVELLLDRVLDSFGVVACGWSASHDIALRAAIERAASRRYSWWWSVRGSEPSGAVSEVIAHRDASLIPGHDADEFFGELADRYAAVGSTQPSDSQDRLIAREVTARRAADPNERQRLIQDLLETAGRVREALGDENRLPRLVGSITAEDVVARSSALVELVRPLAEKTAAVASSADEEVARDVMRRVVEVLVEVPDGLLQRVPALLVSYCFGIVAVDNDRLALLRRVATESMVRPSSHRDAEPLVAALHPWRIFDSNEQVAQWLANEGPIDTKYHTPLSQWLERLCRDLLEPFPVTATEEHWEIAFDRFEWAAGLLLASLAMGREPGDGRAWVPPPHVGNFSWRYRYRHSQQGWSPLEQWAGARADDLLQPLSDEEREQTSVTFAERVEEVARSMW